MFVLVYVDDIVVTGSDSDLAEDVVQLGSEFSLIDLGELNFFLGLEIERCESALFLTQRKYVRELLEKAGMVDARSAPTPMVSTPKLTHDAGCPLDERALYDLMQLAYTCIRVGSPTFM
ncbi:uncharacterized mitochondrial protein AtMg00810-like [Hibiscus syriacus]|uniref:uncharacterized mitochondrial protein AtMg00810-like n=1 Tax=Hibiscus syriacus TaxID=106335 RepID=UPI001924F2DB|nr:uncharacterized mitochondrial protein AtMg00810-like [Hibiscus syriacus]